VSDLEPGAPARGDVLGTRLRVVLALGLIGLLAGFLWGIADVPAYTGTATVLVSADGGEVDPAELDRLAALGETEKVAAKAAAKLGRDVPGADLLSEVTVSPAPARGGLVVRASADAPDIAAAAANGYAAALVDVGGKDLEAGAAAEPPDSPSSNRSAPLWSAIGLLAGLALGGALVLALGARRRSEDREEPAPIGTEPAEAAPAAAAPAEPSPESPGGPELDVIALPAGPPTERSEDGLRPAPGAADALDDLLDDAAVGEEGGVVKLAVLGAGAAELGLGLAAAASARGLTVIVVEADLAEPRLAELAGVPAAPGLGDYLRGDAGPRDVLRSAKSAGGPPVVCLPAGEEGDGGAALLAAARFEALARRLPRVYDLVLLTGPLPRGERGGPVAAVADAVVLVGGGRDLEARLAEAAREVGAGSLLGAVSMPAEAAQSRPQGGMRRS
jgi:Mrp family chromosome partitioning ATPase